MYAVTAAKGAFPMKHMRILALLLAAVLLAGIMPGLSAEAKAETTLQYWIGVDVQNQRTTIYRTSDNSVVHRWLCTTGASGTPTPQGTFYLPAASGSAMYISSERRIAAPGGCTSTRCCSRRRTTTP